MKVYVATTGEYSDYTIRGVFSTKELAEELLRDVNSRNDVEEYEVDKHPAFPIDGYKIYKIEMDSLTGNASWCNAEIEGASKWIDPDEWHHSVPDARSYRDDHIFSLYVIAKSKEAAVKIANEKRTQLIALGLLDVNKDCEGKFSEPKMPELEKKP